MDDHWTPPLVVREHGGRCRLWLGGEAWGDGATLQQAADDLIARVLRHALALRSAGFAATRDVATSDRNWLGFLYEVSEIAARGGDVRGRVFGFPDQLDQAA
jgi:hypothetical protein